MADGSGRTGTQISESAPVRGPDRDADVSAAVKQADSPTRRAGEGLW